VHPRLVVDNAAARLEGPLLFLRRTLDVGLNEAVEVTGSDGAARLGRIAAIDESLVTIELLESSAGLGLAGTTVRFFGEPPSASAPVSSGGCSTASGA
jgi:V/A-type H+-transporting ATPase subunit B